MSTPPAVLDDILLAGVLKKLGLGSRPAANLKGLQAIYGAWCKNIPFDNLRKRIHLESLSGKPLPGDDPADFFQGWLNHGVGGTCWVGSGAFHALLQTLGFQVQRALAIMQISPDVQPNHGTVLVTIKGRTYLVDTSLLHQIPLRLDDRGFGKSRHSAWGIVLARHALSWQIRWRPLHMLDGCRCTLDKIGVSHQVFVACHQRTRFWGPFNYSLYARINRDDSVIGLASGHRIIIDRHGRIERMTMDKKEQDEFLLQEMGFSREIVQQLPADRATPPPPRSAGRSEEY